MNRLIHTAVRERLACLAVMALFLVAATPLPATESEIKAKPEKSAEAQADDAEQAPPEQATEATETEICVDTEEDGSFGMNTFEDIYSVSGGNLAVLLALSAQPPAEEKPEVEEVRWTEVETTGAKAPATPEKDKD